MSPWNFSSAFSTVSRCTWLKPAQRRIFPDESYVSVSQPSNITASYVLVESRNFFKCLVPPQMPATRMPSANGSSVPPWPILTSKRCFFRRRDFWWRASASRRAFSASRPDLKMGETLNSLCSSRRTSADVMPAGLLTAGTSQAERAQNGTDAPIRPSSGCDILARHAAVRSMCAPRGGAGGSAADERRCVGGCRARDRRQFQLCALAPWHVWPVQGHANRT